MATILGQKRGSSAGFKASSDGAVEYTETIVYQVETESATVSKQEVLLTSGLPVVNQSFIAVGPFGAAALCVSKDATQSKINGSMWDVVCQFSSAARRSQQQSEGQQTSDPTTWAPQFTSFSEQIEEVLWSDKNGDPIVNPVGELFADPITTPITIPGIRFVQFEQDWSVDLLIERNNTVNSAIFKGRAVNELLLTVEDQQPVYRNGIFCHAITYAIRYHPRTWQESRLRAASFYLDGSGNKKRFRDSDGNPIDHGIVNADGTIAASQIPTSTSFDYFDKFNELDFNDFLRV